MTDEEALQHLGGSDESAARRAFDHLYKKYRSFTGSVLRRRYSDCNPSDIENAAQQTFLNLWQSRLNIKISDLPAWRGLVSMTAQRCYIDILRAHKPESSLDGPGQEPSGKDDLKPILEDLARATLIRQVSYAANVCWLGLPRTHALDDHNRRLLAARLFYLEEAEKDEILDLLNRSHPGMRPLSTAALTEWLSDPATLRHLAYSELYFSPAALTIHLLGMEEETVPEILDALLTDLTADASSLPRNIAWTPAEVHAILWRYYRNVNLHREHIIPQSRLNLEELSIIFDRCRSLFPFSTQMEELLTRTDGELEAVCGPLQPGLWRRLAFQYRYLDDLAHQDIEERIEPAARQVHFLVSETVLQGWLSSKRLLTALLKTCNDLFEEYKHE